MLLTLSLIIGGFTLKVATYTVGCDARKFGIILRVSPEEKNMVR